MSKFELSLAKDYVPSWTYVEAVRELFQNALDQETTMEDNEMFFKYDEETETLSIGNKTSILSTSTLLLGATTKSSDDKTIGQFGEGYKLATLVLTREGRTVTFYNYGAKEVWKPRFVKSRRYEGSEILTFFVDKKYPWQGVPDNNLTIEVSGITSEEYEKIVKSNLHLQDVGKVFNTDKGRILLDEKHKGKVFVNGLHICNYDEYHYGYDFNPRELNIDRDRRLVDNFDLRWLASQMWLKQGSEEMRKMAAQLIVSGAADTEYVDSVTSEGDNYAKTSNYVYETFREEYGDDAVPVSNQEELESISSDFKPVMVSSEYKHSITSSEKYVEPKMLYKPSAKQKLGDWLSKYHKSLTKKAAQDLRDIISEMD
ncbi:hypothetical protein [Oceanobacillus sp. FSL H7-0719]|uniref:hypothetical protein n=1 Tax=Oceanobacillus sp. FSL H7-0719 TaxID=2954507 RepID=UPI003249A8D8